MALGYGQTEFQPYGDDELMQLEGLLGGQSLGAPEPVPMAGADPMAPSMPAPMPTMAPEPVAPMTPASAMTPQQPAGFQLPPQPEPLDTTFPASKSPGLPLAGVSYSGLPIAERDKLGSMYGQLAENQYGAIDRAATTEAGIQQGRIAGADKRVGAANVEANKAQMALAGQHAARAKLEAEGAEWSKRKEEPAKAFEGIEWAGVLAGIGIGAGTFAQAMGWQHGNPVLEQFDKIVGRSVAAQREQKQSRLQEINARIGDSRASEQILTAQLHDAIADRAAAEQQKATSQEAFDRLGSIVEAERAKVQESILGAYERMATREERQFARPQATGPGKSPLEVEKEIQDLVSVWEKNGYDKDQIAGRLEKLGLSSPQGKSAAELAREKETSETGKYTDTEGRAEAASEAINALGGKAGLRRDPTTGKWAPGDGALPPAVGEGVKGFFGGATPVNDALTAAAQAYGRFQSGGVIGPDEEKQFREMLGASTMTRAQLAEKLNAAEVTVHARRPRVKREQKPGAPSNWK